MTALQVAFHEAGHGVVAYRLGLDCGLLSILPEPGTVGRSFSEYPWKDGSIDAKVTTVLLAGYVAEHEMFPDADRRTSRLDDEEARELVKRGCAGSIEECQSLAVQMVRKDWRHIEAVATALVEAKSLVAEEWDIIISALDEGLDWREFLEELRKRLKSAPRDMAPESTEGQELPEA